MTDIINGVVRALAPLVIAWLVKKGLKNARVVATERAWESELGTAACAALGVSQGPS